MPPSCSIRSPENLLHYISRVKIIQNIKVKLMKDRTTFVIAHRLSTVKEADKLLVMDGGEIVEMGKHDELIEKGGTYAKLVEMQELLSDGSTALGGESH